MRGALDNHQPGAGNFIDQILGILERRHIVLGSGDNQRWNRDLTNFIHYIELITAPKIIELHGGTYFSHTINYFLLHIRSHPTIRRYNY